MGGGWGVRLEGRVRVGWGGGRGERGWGVCVGGGDSVQCGGRGLRVDAVCAWEGSEPMQRVRRGSGV